MRILITGICGFVGSTLASCLVETYPGYEIFGIDNYSRNGSWLNKSTLEGKGIRIYHGDLRLASDLEVVPKVDWVIDAAANPNIMAGVDGKTSSLQLVQNNLIATINILEFCKKNQSGFILLSTSRVYSIAPLTQLRMQVFDKAYMPVALQDFPKGVSTLGVNEEFSTVPPVSLYGCTKSNSEALALEYGITYRFPVWINRCGVMAGPGQFGHPGQGIFAYWIHSFQEARPLKYIGFGGSGFQVRDCLHPRDLISLLQKQFNEPLDSEKSRVLNVSGGVENSMSLAQLTSWCKEHVGTTSIEHIKTERPFDVPWMVLDNEKAGNTWGWFPQTDITQILLEISNFASTRSNWCAMSAS